MVRLFIIVYQIKSLAKKNLRRSEAGIKKMPCLFQCYHHTWMVGKIKKLSQTIIVYLRIYGREEHVWNAHCSLFKHHVPSDVRT